MGGIVDTVFLLKGSDLKRKDNTLLVVLEDKTRKRLPIENVQHIVCAGGIKLNSEVLSFLGKHGVRMSFLDYYGNYSGTLEPKNMSGAGNVHLAQARIILDSKTRVSFGHKILSAGVSNMLRNLRYYAYRDKQNLKEQIKEIEDFWNKTNRTNMSVEELLGNEGLVRALYYSSWKNISPDLDIKVRSRRPPEDRINAAISFSNSLVYSACSHAIRQTQLDPTLSFVHAPTQKRQSLALDFAEIFKPIIADRMVFSLFNLKTLDHKDFEEHSGACLLSENGREKFLLDFHSRMNDTPINGEPGWRRIILKEAFALEAGVLGLREYVPFIARA
jgi:CRISPR-associated protein Cas1